MRKNNAFTLLFASNLLALPVLADEQHERHEQHEGHDHAPVVMNKNPAAGPDAVTAVAELPPPPAGVTHVAFREFFVHPVGRRGLEYTPKVKSLAGRKVRILGYMVGTDKPAPGLMMLAPFPVELHESEYGLADDLPPSALHVLVPGPRDRAVPFTPGPLLLTGTLELGAKPMPDGRRSNIRLLLDPPDIASGADPHEDRAQ